MICHTEYGKIVVPQPPVFESKEEATRWLAEQQAIDESYSRMARELFYQTIRDAHAYATNYTNRFKACGGNRSFDAEAAKVRAYNRIMHWVNTKCFENIAKHLHLDNAKRTVVDLMHGKNVEKIEPLINEMKHAGRIYANRGPSPKAKKNKEGQARPNARDGGNRPAE